MVHVFVIVCGGINFQHSLFHFGFFLMSLQVMKTAADSVNTFNKLQMILA
jgi:hypothetical protein